MVKALKLKNNHGELLDVLVEGKEDAATTVIMAHGNGTDKDEGTMYIDLSHALANSYRIVRFDFSACGKSEGNLRDVTYWKHGEDLQTIIDWVRKTYGESIYLVAHSQGTSITSMLSPEGIEKIVLSGITNSSKSYILERTIKRIKEKGGTVNFQGISTRPRSTGEVHEIGPDYWKSREEFEPIRCMKNLQAKTNLLVIRPMQDEIVGSAFMEEYESISNLKFRKLNGDHRFEDPKDRAVFIEVVKEFFESE